MQNYQLMSIPWQKVKSEAFYASSKDVNCRNEWVFIQILLAFQLWIWSQSMDTSNMVSVTQKFALFIYFWIVNVSHEKEGKWTLFKCMHTLPIWIDSERDDLISIVQVLSRCAHIKEIFTLFKVSHAKALLKMDTIEITDCTWLTPFHHNY